MPVETEEDRQGLLADFGVACKHSGSAGFLGIMDDGFIDPLDVEGTEPQLLCSTVDVADVDEDDTVAIDGTDWTVKVKRPDGQGMTTLILERP